MALGVVFMSGSGLVEAAANKLTIRWLGQACFLVTSPKGTKVLMDPVPSDIGYSHSPVQADVITISHEHFDHTNVKLAQGNPKILRGLSGNTWNKIDTNVGDVHIRSVGVYHDTKKGALRGLDAIFILEVAGTNIVHLGDLGHVLDDSQVKAVGKVDVLLIPVGGFYTIDAKDATSVVEQLSPKRLIIPMHYKTDVLTIKELAPVDGFLAKKSGVQRVDSNVYELDLSGKPTGPASIIVLDYK